MIEIIAEVGITHGGSVDMAMNMAELVKDAGGKTVKYQTFNPEKLIYKNDPSYVTLCELALSHTHFKALARFCEEIEIEFLSTPGDLDSLRFLVEECGVRRLKIGSDDLTYKPLMESAAKSGLPLIISTGMATLREVDLAIPPVMNDITLLHCVSAYPCVDHNVNLRAMQELKTLGFRVGYSDHTPHYDACLMAAAMGASIIEKHVRPFGWQGPDACVSIECDDLHQLIQKVAKIEIMLGHGKKIPCPAEVANIPIFRKDETGFRGMTA